MLTRLHLSRVNLTDTGAAALLEALTAPNAPPVASLILDGNPHLSESVLAALDAVTRPRRESAPPPAESASCAAPSMKSVSAASG